MSKEKNAQPEQKSGQPAATRRSKNAAGIGYLD